jgi:uncharacterized protein (DUF305 family)
MVENQKKEKAQMTQWLQQWHSQKPGPMDMSDPSMKKSMGDLAKLKQVKGNEFDKLFAKSMSEHHAQGLATAKLAQQKAEHDQLKRLAGKMVKDQQEEKQNWTDTRSESVKLKGCARAQRGKR